MSRPAPLKPLLALIATACFVMLGSALLLQHQFGWEPCTLCIQIRLWLLCGGVVSLLILAVEALGLRWLSLPLWPLLLALLCYRITACQPTTACCSLSAVR